MRYWWVNQNQVKMANRPSAAPGTTNDSYGQDTSKLFPGALLDAHKSSRFRCIAGLTSHCIRLMGVVETGLLAGPSEKKVAKPAAVLNRRFLRWGLRTRGCRIAAISRDFQREAAGLLCNPDCLAERVGFEPACKRKPKDLQRTGSESKAL